MAYQPSEPPAYYGQHMVDTVASNSFYRRPRPNEYESENGPAYEQPSSSYAPQSFYNPATRPYQSYFQPTSDTESYYAQGDSSLLLQQQAAAPPIPPRPQQLPADVPPPIPDKPQDLFGTLMAHKRETQRTGRSSVARTANGGSPWLGDRQHSSQPTDERRDSMASGIYSLYGSTTHHSPVASTSSAVDYTASSPSTASSSTAYYPSSAALRPAYPAQSPQSFDPSSFYSSQLAPLVAPKGRSSSRSATVDPLPQPSTTAMTSGPPPLPRPAPSRSAPPAVSTIPNAASQLRQALRKPSILTTPPPITESPQHEPDLNPLAQFSSASASTSSLAPSLSLNLNLRERRNLSPSSPAFPRDNSSLSVASHAPAQPDYLNPSLLSNIAVWTRDSVQLGVRTKGAVEYPDAFTGKDLVDTIQGRLTRPFNVDRKYALAIARSLQVALWFHEVDWSDAPLRDDDKQVYAFTEQEYREEADDVPTSVLTPLTKCYSPFCGQFKQDGLRYTCYSITCPNTASASVLLQRQPSLVSPGSSQDMLEDADNWASSVPKSVIDGLDKREIARQSLIFELIQGEQHYRTDLCIVDEHFVKPLKATNVISPHRLSDFVASILLTMSDITKHSLAFLTALQERQRKGPIVSGIGDIVLAAALDWSRAYLTFMVNFPLADSLLKEEKHNNARFAEFLMDFNKRSPATKKGFDTFHSRPAFRLLRYVLLVEQILKNTPDEMTSEKNNLEQAIAVIKRQSSEANEGIVKTKSMVACREWHRDIVKKPTDGLDLDLLNTTRTHFMSGKAWRKGEGSGFSEWVECHLVLFDHYLVTTKAPRADRDGTMKYPIARRAVPLDLVQLRPNSFTDPAVVKSQGFHLRPTRFNSNEQPQTPSAAGMGAGSSESLVYPISFLQIGRHNGIVTYFVDTESQRSEWSKQLGLALKTHAEVQERNKVVRLDVLSDQTFGAETVGSLAPSAPVSAQFGRPTCSVPATVRGTDLVLAGCAEGVFIGFRGKPRSMKSLIQLKGITQCAVLEEFGFILVVANGILIAYSLEALVPSSSSRTANGGGNGTSSSSGGKGATSKAPQRLSGQKDVLFFKCGKIVDDKSTGSYRTLVIYVKKGGVKESIFKALEPVKNADTSRGGGGGASRSSHHTSTTTSNSSSKFLGLGGSKPEWFRTYKDFFLPTPVSTVQFMRSQLAIVCQKGIEIMNLETLRTMSVPDFGAFKNEPVLSSLSRRCEDSKALGMFRLADNLFLLCYDDFALHVDKHGEPFSGGSSGLMDWDSKPEQVAFIHPHIYGFSSNMVEIRHAFTGRLAQVITGSQITLTYDGVSLSPSSLSTSTSAAYHRRASDESNLSSSTAATTSQGDPDRVLHFSMRVGSFHVLYEMSPVGLSSSNGTGTATTSGASASSTGANGGLGGSTTTIASSASSSVNRSPVVASSSSFFRR